MGRYLIRRLLFFILVLFIVSVFTFIIFVKLPSVDPAIRAAGRHPSALLLATIRHKFGLDQPLVRAVLAVRQGPDSRGPGSSSTRRSTSPTAATCR